MVVLLPMTVLVLSSDDLGDDPGQPSAKVYPRRWERRRLPNWETRTSGDRLLLPSTTGGVARSGVARW